MKVRVRVRHGSDIPIPITTEFIKLESFLKLANAAETGGMAKNIVPYCRHKIVLDEYLLLKGLFKATHH